MGLFFSPMPSDFVPRQQQSARDEADRVVEQIESMVNDDRNRWRWASETLEAIRDTIEQTGRVTEGQARAVTNIENAVLNR